MSSSLTVQKPPTPFSITGKSVFLAGSIEMGSAPDWQAALTETLSARLPSTTITVLNPRRGNWDGGWVQSIHNAQFKEQVDWELDAQDTCDVIAMYFSPGTKSPISLLELGLYAASGKIVVCCPEGFWRKGNVEIVCHRYGIKLSKNSRFDYRLRGCVLMLMGLMVVVSETDKVDDIDPRL
ncbi:hypothetical protein Cob_v013027 [Colletotrichum orbiculare MAFF 240422]|uniref:Nucleoside 2-deoxyribosyltransferase domain-containing protein n=1 Tax=Colletotrichum orbiculare (strain 104-T / ATCC 96160 / CBS 514.97 / LARS 414 / MAFF 240422) TaxID=1213857 RepID=A0A484F786_COLOR|nr:hypothetical protein Cob_v013027 [Colletotrichum orbiculare MAFF 240422]